MSTAASSTSQHEKDPEKDAELSAETPPGAPRTAPAGPPPPPDGGAEAWLQVAGGFCLFFNNWGILNAFGVYQNYYESGALFQASSSEISWTGSVTAFLLLLTGLFAGPVFDRGWLRSLLAFGSFLIVFGHMMLSLSTEYYQVLLSQGFCIGIGTGCLFVPSIAVCPQWFSKRLGFAVGIATSGAALGGVIYPIVLNRLIPEVGFPWAVRTIGFIALAMLILPVATLKQRIKPPKPRALLDMSAFLDVGFLGFVVSTFLSYLGLFVNFFYLSYFARAQDITSESMSIYLVAIFNAGSVFGRTIPNFFADKTGPFNLVAPSTILSGMFMFCMLAVDSFAGIIVISIISGFFSGALIGLPPLCLMSVTRAEGKMALFGTRMGMAYGLIAFSLLASGPIAGAILGTGESLNWTGLWVFGGVPTTVAGCLYYGLRFWVYGLNPFTKA